MNSRQRNNKSLNNNTNNLSPNNNNNAVHLKIIANLQVIIKLKVQDKNEYKIHIITKNNTKKNVLAKITQLNNLCPKNTLPERAVMIWVKEGAEEEEEVEEGQMLDHLTITVKKYKTKRNISIKGRTAIYIHIDINMEFKILLKENLYLGIINQNNHKNIQIGIKRFKPNNYHIIM